MAPRITEQEWDTHFDSIKELWDVGWEIATISAQMHLVHRFDATLKQYRDEFERRGMNRNLKKEDRDALCAFDLGRQLQGKTSTRYRARKRDISPRTLTRHMKEHGPIEPSFHQPSISYFECETSQYDLDNPHIQALLNQDVLDDFVTFDGLSAVDLDLGSSEGGSVAIGAQFGQPDSDMAPWDPTGAPPTISEDLGLDIPVSYCSEGFGTDVLTESLAERRLLGPPFSVAVAAPRFSYARPQWTPPILQETQAAVGRACRVGAQPSAQDAKMVVEMLEFA